VKVSCLRSGPTVSHFRQQGRHRQEEALPHGCTDEQSASVAELATAPGRTTSASRSPGCATVCCCRDPFLPRTTVLGIVKNLQSPL
jgi:hypothetical protein